MDLKIGKAAEMDKMITEMINHNGHNALECFRREKGDW